MQPSAIGPRGARAFGAPATLCCAEGLRLFRDGVNDANPYAPPASEALAPPACRLARAARVLWLLYVMASAPLAFVGLGLFPVFMYGLFRDVPHGKAQDDFKLLPLIALGVMWILSVALAHRFNAGRRHLIPFAANFLAVLLLFSAAIASGGIGKADAIYPGVLLLLLAAGAGCTQASARRAKEQQDGP